MQLTVPTGISLAVANLIRGTILSQFPSWRPFAYEFDSKASILSVDSIMEDPISIHGAVSSLTFTLDRDPALGEILPESYAVEGRFTVGQLKSLTQFQLSGVTDGFPLFTSVKPLNVKVWYLFSSGKRDEDQNRKLLPTSNNVVIFSSRHTSVEEISFKLNEISGGLTEIIFTCSEVGVVEKAIGFLSNYLVAA